MDDFGPFGETKLKKILDLGYPAVHDHLAEIMVWLQDVNWPGSMQIGDFLVSIGEPVIPHVKQVFANHDTEWKRNVVSQMVERWPREFVVQIESELMKLIWNESGNLDIEVMFILLKHKLGNEAEIRRRVEDKIISSEIRLRELRKIEDHLSTYGA